MVMGEYDKPRGSRSLRYDKTLKPRGPWLIVQEELAPFHHE
jgi:hypothetical protein